MTNGKTGRYDRDHIGVIRRIRLCIGFAVLLLVTFGFVLGLAAAGDSAMEPDYGKGRPVLFFRLASDYKRGDVVVMRLENGKTVLRRVIAVAGDTVELRGGMVYINGITERGNYTITRTEPAEDGMSYPALLRQGEYFVLGDLREISTDSRSLGLLTRQDILGKVLE